MACDITTLCDPVCAPPTGPAEQNWALTELLLLVLAELDVEAETDPDVILTENECLTCKNAGILKRQQTQVICDGIADINCTRLHCYSPEQVEAIKLVALCGIVNALSP